MEQRLRVIYSDVSNVKMPDKKIDKAIGKTAKSLGFKWYGQGYDFTTNERDIVFSREV